MKRKMVAFVAAILSLSISNVCYVSAEGHDMMLRKDPVNQVVAKGGNEGVQPFYDKTINISAGLKISGSTAYATAHVTAKNVCNVNIVMRLQRKEGSDWHTIVSWVGGSDKGYKTLDKTHTLTTRGTYRVYALFDVDGEKLDYVGNTATY